MRRVIPFVLALVLVVSVRTSAQDPPLERANPLEGVWSITELTLSTADTSVTYTDPPPGVFIFTGHHYSILHHGGEPLAEPLSDEATDAERLAVLDGLRASLGTYEVSGSTITITRMVARLPNMVGGTADIEYQIEGDTLELNWVTEAWTAIFTFVRLE